MPEIRTSRPSTLRCPRCGREYPAVARFCVDCNVALKATGSSCPSCGGSVPEGARFCPACSAPLTGGAVAAAISSPARVAAPVAGESQGGGKLGTYLLIWVVTWVAIGGLVRFLLAPEEPEALLGVGLAAVLSLVLMLRSLGESWSGEITEIRTERIEVGDDEDSHLTDMNFAYIRQPNGKVKRMGAMPDWRVGNHLEKRRGEAGIRVT